MSLLLLFNPTGQTWFLQGDTTTAWNEKTDTSTTWGEQSAAPTYTSSIFEPRRARASGSGFSAAKRWISGSETREKRSAGAPPPSCSVAPRSSPCAPDTRAILEPSADSPSSAIRLPSERAVMSRASGHIGAEAVPK